MIMQTHSGEGNGIILLLLLLLLLRDLRPASGDEAVLVDWAGVTRSLGPLASSCGLSCHHPKKVITGFLYRNVHVYCVLSRSEAVAVIRAAEASDPVA